MVLQTADVRIFTTFAHNHMSLLTVTNITKQYGADVLVNNVSFEQRPLQNIAIAGETGSGKTTLMQIIAGLGQADSGEVLFENKKVKGITEKLMPGHSGIGYLSQHFELPKKYRVAELLAYANKLTERASAELYDICRIDHLLHRWSHTLSGGERQRVALAKLLTESPRLLCLDEPYSNMDLIHKQVLKAVVNDLRDRLGITCILISHDAEDMLPWADEILVMQQGAIIQRGNPRHIYRQPQSPYTAGLFGKYNTLPPTLAAMLNMTNLYIRPEQLALVWQAHGGIPVTVHKKLFMGSHYEFEVACNDQMLIVANGEKDLQPGDSAFVVPGNDSR